MYALKKTSSIDTELAVASTLTLLSNMASIFISYPVIGIAASFISGSLQLFQGMMPDATQL